VETMDTQVPITLFECLMVRAVNFYFWNFN
jgi:hypothetical protein